MGVKRRIRRWKRRRKHRLDQQAPFGVMVVHAPEGFDEDMLELQDFCVGLMLRYMNGEEIEMGPCTVHGFILDVVSLDDLYTMREMRKNED